jgi:hypothetical protein
MMKNMFLALMFCIMLTNCKNKEAASLDTFQSNVDTFDRVDLLKVIDSVKNVSSKILDSQNFKVIKKIVQDKKINSSPFKEINCCRNQDNHNEVQVCCCDSMLSNISSLAKQGAIKVCNEIIDTDPIVAKCKKSKKGFMTKIEAIFDQL